VLYLNPYLVFVKLVAVGAKSLLWFGLPRIKWGGGKAVLP
jgi:hypothetical protein